MNSDMVEVATSDKLLLHGFYSNARGKTAVLHLHGFEGNFYENYFLQPVYKKLRENNISFLSANTRGTGKITDIKKTDGSSVTIGAWNERLEEAYLDIDAWTKFLTDEGYEKIILQGHSLGTVKSVRFLFEGTYREKVKKLILLSPFDAKSCVEKTSSKPINSLIKKSISQVKRGNGKKDARVPPWFGMSHETFLSWYRENNFKGMFEFGNKPYDFPHLKKIPVPTLVVVGSNDTYFHPSNPKHPEEAAEILAKNIPDNRTILIPNTDHWFGSYENQLAAEIHSFITS